MLCGLCHGKMAFTSYTCVSMATTYQEVHSVSLSENKTLMPVLCERMEMDCHMAWQVIIDSQFHFISFSKYRSHCSFQPVVYIFSASWFNCKLPLDFVSRYCVDWVVHRLLLATFTDKTCIWDGPWPVWKQFGREHVWNQVETWPPYSTAVVY